MCCLPDNRSVGTVCCLFNPKNSGTFRPSNCSISTLTLNRSVLYCVCVCILSFEQFEWTMIIITIKLWGWSHHIVNYIYIAWQQSTLPLLLLSPRASSVNPLVLKEGLSIKWWERGGDNHDDSYPSLDNSHLSAHNIVSSWLFSFFPSSPGIFVHNSQTKKLYSEILVNYLCLKTFFLFYDFQWIDWILQYWQSSSDLFILLHAYTPFSSAVAFPQTRKKTS